MSKDSGRGSPHPGADDVARHQVRGELQPVEGAADDSCEGAHRERLRDPGDSLEEQVAAGQQPDQHRSTMRSWPTTTRLTSNSARSRTAAVRSSGGTSAARSTGPPPAHRSPPRSGCFSGQSRGGSSSTTVTQWESSAVLAYGDSHRRRSAAAVAPNGRHEKPSRRGSRASGGGPSGTRPTCAGQLAGQSVCWSSQVRPPGSAAVTTASKRAGKPAKSRPKTERKRVRPPSPARGYRFRHAGAHRRGRARPRRGRADRPGPRGVRRRRGLEPAEAETKLAVTAYDLLLLDVTLTDGNGLSWPRRSARVRQTASPDRTCGS